MMRRRVAAAQEWQCPVCDQLIRPDFVVMKTPGGLSIAVCESCKHGVQAH